MMTPRNGHTFVVGIGARISGCANQKEASLEDQVDHGKEVTEEYNNGPKEFRTICTKGKGERLDRPELAEIEAMLRTRELDLLVFEDLGRLVRGATAVSFLGLAVDCGTRVAAHPRALSVRGTLRREGDRRRRSLDRRLLPPFGHLRGLRPAGG